MAESTIELLETIADATIVMASVWAGWLYLRNYRRTRAWRAGILAAAFSFVALFKGLHLLGGSVLGLETFAWMDTILVSEVLIVLLIGINIIVIPGRVSWRGRLSSRLEEATGENRKKAA